MIGSTNLLYHSLSKKKQFELTVSCQHGNRRYSRHDTISYALEIHVFTVVFYYTHNASIRYTKRWQQSYLTESNNYRKILYTRNSHVLDSKVQYTDEYVYFTFDGIIMDDHNGHNGHNEYFYF